MHDFVNRRLPFVNRQAGGRDITGLQRQIDLLGYIELFQNEPSKPVV